MHICFIYVHVNFFFGLTDSHENYVDSGVFINFGAVVAAAK